MKKSLKWKTAILTAVLALTISSGSAFASENETVNNVGADAIVSQTMTESENQVVESESDAYESEQQNNYSYTAPEENVDPSPVDVIADGWHEQDGALYYYEGGQPVKGLRSIADEQGNQNLFYFDVDTGVMSTGLHVVTTDTGNATYYFDENTGYAIKNCEKKIDGFWYYFGEDGKMVTGHVYHHDAWYQYNENGQMLYGWQNVDGNNYFFDQKTGRQAVGCEKKIDGFWYYFDDNGFVVTGWAQHHDHTYYYQPNGQMTYGEAKIDGHWYYFKEKSGVMATGWSKHDNHTYYYQSNGQMTYGEKKIDGYWYYFKERTGVMATGWSKHDNHTYYYQSNGQMTYGEKKISNHWYYFKPRTGVMATGWTNHSGKRYYYNAKGQMLYGWQEIDGNAYFFDKKTGVVKPYTFKKSNGLWLAYDGNGKLVKDLRSLFGNESSYVIKVNKPMNTVTIYTKYKDGSYTVPLVAFICSTGADTPTGTFYTPDRWRWLRMMGPSWGQWVTQISGDYLFHSVYYNSANNNNTLSVSAYNNLGKQVSHGCIRLTAGDAKWIYDHCALKTKVVIYSDTSSYGPLGRPSAYKLPSWHTWDPTDPNMYYKCRERGCH